MYVDCEIPNFSLSRFDATGGKRVIVRSSSNSAA